MLYRPLTKARFESDLEAALQRTHGGANFTYDNIKMLGQSLQKLQKYADDKEIIELKFSKNYISNFMLRHGLRQN